jgi:peptidoglycan/LPS O-acetylase OafA/YrhL
LLVTGVVGLVLGVLTYHWYIQYLLPWMVPCFGVGILTAVICGSQRPWAVALRRQAWGWIFLASMVVLVGVDSWLKYTAASPEGVYGIVPGMAYYRLSLAWRATSDLLAAVAFGALIVWLMGARSALSAEGAPTRSRASAWFLAVLESKPISGLGRIGYSLYLTHGLIVVLTYRLVSPFVTTQFWQCSLILTLGLAASIAVGWVFFMLIERRFAEVRRR